MASMSKVYDEETRAKAMRLVREHRDEYASKHAAIEAVAFRLGMSPETLRIWLRDSDAGDAVEATAADSAAEVRALKRKNAELEQTIEILKAATSFFARESDPLRR
jgi:transposase